MINSHVTIVISVTELMLLLQYAYDTSLSAQPQFPVHLGMLKGFFHP
jgi:hypothetical protein